jgi:hypothetical protein
MGYIAELAVELGIATWLLIVILVWTLIWKLMAMWKSAKNSHLVWFIVLAIFNTVGILPILYIYVFSDLKDFKKKNLKKTKKSKKKTSKKKPVKKPKKK